MDDLPIILCFLFPYFGFGPEYEYRCPPGPEWGEGGGKIPSILSIEMFNRSMPIGFKDVRFNNIGFKGHSVFLENQKKTDGFVISFSRERIEKWEREGDKRKKRKGIVKERNQFQKKVFLVKFCVFRFDERLPFVCCLFQNL